MRLPRLLPLLFAGLLALVCLNGPADAAPIRLDEFFDFPALHVTTGPDPTRLRITATEGTFQGVGDLAMDLHVRRDPEGGHDEAHLVIEGSVPELGLEDIFFLLGRIIDVTPTAEGFHVFMQLDDVPLGVGLPEGGLATWDLRTTAVPLPAPWALLLAGLATWAGRSPSTRRSSPR